MLQKTTWMHYLIFGISLLVLSSTNSCSDNEDKDCLVISDFIYVNNTTHIIETPIGIINQNSSISKRDEGKCPCNIDSSNFVPPFLGETEIIFDNIKCLVYQSVSAGNGDGPVGIDNYSIIEISNNHYEFTYEFTEEEYEQAEDCD